MRYRVIKEYRDAPQNPIEIKKDEVLEFIEESDQDGDWPNWIFCRGKNKEGWIPRQILDVDGTIATASEDYSAKEHNLEKGEVLISRKKLNGWVYGEKESNPGTLGWAPLNHLQMEE